MLRLRSLIPALACAAVIGVGGCGVLFPKNTESNVAGLKAFTSNDELRNYFQQQISLRNSALQTIDRAFSGAEDGGGQPESPTTDGDSAGGPPQLGESGDDEAENHSGTTVQEEGVDEADVVKTDGDYIYMLSNSYSGDGGAVLRILQATPDQLEVVSETNIDGWGQDIYLRGDQVVALTSGGGVFFYAGGGGGIAEDGVVVSGGTAVADGDGVSSDGDAAIDEPFAPGEYEFERPYTAVTILDVSDRTNPQITSTTRFDGSQAASRMIDGVLHLVLANYQAYYYDIMPMMGRPELDVADVAVEDMLPDYEREMPGEESSGGGDLVTWENLYHPIDADGFGVVTVVSMDTTAADAPFTSVGVVAEPGLVYSSLNALYLTDTAYTFDGTTRTTTDVYKLLFVDNEAVPTASGAVPGRVLNQYSMSEFEGNLRVATTIDGEFFFDPIFGGGERTDPVNNVYVLGEAEGEEGTVLEVVGSLEDIAPGETIQSARFVGAKGFLVTFEQLDPLFTLDLSDATNPEIVGEWHGPGFSTFMAPMGENHVLAVGQYVPPPGEFGIWGVQLSIFDVSDFAHPTQLSNVVLGGDTGSYSEALWNPKAFTYFAEEGLVALPLSVYGGFVIEPGMDVDGDGGGTVDGSDGGGSSGSGGEADAPPPDDVVEPSEPTDPEKPDGVLFPEDQFEGIVVFRATPEDGLVELGRISTLFDDRGFYYPGFSRGVFVGDHVYAVTDFGTRVAPVADLETIADELFYGPEFIEEPPSDPIDPIPVDPTEPGTSEPMPGDDGSASGKTNP
jgi:uncharacterized secreted protein with C-terminal beta-propeller domain